MRDPKRIGKILKIIEKIWRKSPDLRFCQLIENVLGCNNESCIYYIEDDKLEKALERWNVD